MQKEIEIIKDGLSYNEELECIAKRFGMTLICVLCGGSNNGRQCTS